MTGMYRSLSPTYQTAASRRDTHSSASAMACIDCTSACSHMSRCLLMPAFARFEARAGGWLAIPSFRLAFWLLASPCLVCLPTALSDRRFPRPGSCCPRQRPGTAGGCGCASSGCCCARDSSLLVAVAVLHPAAAAHVTRRAQGMTHACAVVTV